MKFAATLSLKILSASAADECPENGAIKSMTSYLDAKCKSENPYFSEDLEEIMVMTFNTLYSKTFSGLCIPVDDEYGNPTGFNAMYSCPAGGVAGKTFTDGGCTRPCKTDECKKFEKQYTF